MHFQPPHEVDEIGYPTDPELNRLEIYLSDLAAKFRGADTLEYQDTIVEEYHTTMQRLYDLGWDAVLDVDAELPEDDMPSEYKKRHPCFRGRFF
jgi:hypothetical protein